MSHQKDKRPRILIASAWTGGHIFPGISICEAIKKRHKRDMEIFFITNKKGPAANILHRYGYKTIFLDTGGIKGKGKGAIKNILKLLPSFFNSFNIVKRLSPSIILGLGGSLSGPICLAGKLLNIPVLIHEQNLFPGLTNRLLCPFADKIFVSFQETKILLKKSNIIVSGNPVREEFFHIKKQKRDIFTILVMGGSQGSLAINHAFLNALDILRKQGRRIRVIHQTGKIDYELIRDKYEELALQDCVVVPFIEDMPSVFREVDLVISRSGASTIFELSASGTPSILIPYPYATDQHQEKNARALVRLGGAEIIHQKDLSGQKLAQVITRYMDHPDELKKMQKNAKLLARPESASIIAEHVMEIIKP